MLANTYSRGFTLIEMIIGMVVMAIVLVLAMSFIFPQSRQGIDPIWQVRGLSLAQSLLNEISAKPFDEVSIQPNALSRCNETSIAGVVLCTNSENLGRDLGETKRVDFDDVDDYHGLSAAGAAISNSLGLSMNLNGSDIYAGFQLTVSVFYDDNLDGINDDDVDQNGVLDSGALIGNRKLITVVVTTPSGDQMPFSLVKTNF